MTINPSLRVLHILPGTPYGGIQRLIPQLTSAQLKSGLDVRVLSIYEDERLSSDLRTRGVPFSTTKNRRPSIEGLARFVNAFLEFQPNIVHLHAHLLWSDLLGLTLKREKCPWICHVHSYPAEPRGLKNHTLEAVKTRLCDAYIAVSESVANATRDRLVCIRNEYGSKIFTVYNGIELPEPTPPHTPYEETTLYGMATRMDGGKGVWEFVHVAENIARLQPEARFVLAGDGPLKSSVQEYITAKGMAHVFSVPGHVCNMETFWRSLDVAIFTAPNEAFGLSLIEPMAYGVPVAAYQTGYGSDELIVNSVTGLCAEWGDVDELARQAIRLATDTALKTQIITRAFADVQERFSINAMCSGVEDVYHAMLGD